MQSRCCLLLAWLVKGLLAKVVSAFVRPTFVQELMTDNTVHLNSIEVETELSDPSFEAPKPSQKKKARRET